MALLLVRILFFCELREGFEEEEEEEELVGIGEGLIWLREPNTTTIFVVLSREF